MEHISEVTVPIVEVPVPLPEVKTSVEGEPVPEVKTSVDEATTTLEALKKGIASRLKAPVPEVKTSVDEATTTLEELKKRLTCLKAPAPKITDDNYFVELENPSSQVPLHLRNIEKQLMSGQIPDGWNGPDVPFSVPAGGNDHYKPLRQLPSLGDQMGPCYNSTEMDQQPPKKPHLITKAEQEQHKLMKTIKKTIAKLEATPIAQQCHLYKFLTDMVTKQKPETIVSLLIEAIQSSKTGVSSSCNP